MGLIADTRKALREAPKGIFNAYVFSVTWIFALAGVAKGFDEGKPVLYRQTVPC